MRLGWVQVLEVVEVLQLQLEICTKFQERRLSIGVLI